MLCFYCGVGKQCNTYLNAVKLMQKRQYLEVPEGGAAVL